jgi:hypothetical protein
MLQLAAALARQGRAGSSAGGLQICSLLPSLCAHAAGAHTQAAAAEAGQGKDALEALRSKLAQGELPNPARPTALRWMPPASDQGSRPSTGQRSSACCSASRSSASRLNAGSGCPTPCSQAPTSPTS